MCRACWVEAGSPTDRSVHEPELLGLISALYEDHSAGGPLHTVIDDQNIENNDLYPFYANLDYNEPNVTCLRYVCDRIVELLRLMTMPERQASIARHFGYLKDGYLKDGYLKDQSQGDT